MLNQVKDLVGKRVKLILMNDDPKTCPIEPNTMGTIMSVDDMNYYHPKLMVNGFNPTSDMQMYEFKTYFVPIDQINYNEITRLAKLKNLL